MAVKISILTDMSHRIGSCGALQSSLRIVIDLYEDLDWLVSGLSPWVPGVTGWANGSVCPVFFFIDRFMKGEQSTGRTGDLYVTM